MSIYKAPSFALGPSFDPTGDTIHPCCHRTDWREMNRSTMCQVPHKKMEVGDTNENKQPKVTHDGDT